MFKVIQTKLQNVVLVVNAPEGALTQEALIELASVQEGSVIVVPNGIHVQFMELPLQGKTLLGGLEPRDFCEGIVSRRCCAEETNP